MIVGNTKTITKMLLPSLELNHQFSFNKFKNCIENTANRGLQKAFSDKKILLTTGQQNKLINMLV